MRLEKSAILVLCALLAVACGCGRGGPDIVAVELEEFTNSIGMKFKLIPAGEFMMGSPEDEEDRYDREMQHQVRITNPYYLGVYEVTQGQWEEVMGTRPWEGEKWVKSGPEYAVSYVSWEDAVEFCRKLSTKEGRKYRLPTEAEWEYACRAGSGTRFCFGDDDSELGSYAWCGKNALDIGEEYSHEVGLKRPNAWGLFDMHGNAWEWCSDWFDPYYYEISPVDNPTGPSTGSYRVVHGGGFSSDPWGCRPAYRGRNAPDNRFNFLGFRVALDPAE